MRNWYSAPFVVGTVIAAIWGPLWLVMVLAAVSLLCIVGQILMTMGFGSSEAVAA